MASPDKVRSPRFRWFVLAGIIATVVAIATAFLLRSHALQHDPSAFTIYVVGGSTAQGAPYYGEVDFGRIVALYYGGNLDGRAIRVQNLSRSGIPVRSVLNQVQAIIQSVTTPDSALVFVYTGNNEFLVYDREQDVITSNRSLFDTAIVSAATRQRVLESYRDTLVQVITKLQDAEIPVVLSMVVVNQKDWQPNRSVLANPDNASRVGRLWQAADKAIQTEEWYTARGHLEEIINVEPEFAHACYQLGHCYLKLNDAQHAKRFFQLAIDYDANPTRAVSQQNHYIVQLCRRFRVPLVDAPGVLKNASPHGLIGYNLMWDNCHPTLDGYVLIARALADQVERVTGVIPTRPDLTASQVRERLINGDSSETRALVERAQYCYVNAMITWNRDPRLNRAEQYLDRAAALNPDDPDVACSLGVLQLVQAKVPESLSAFKRAHRLDPERTRQRVNNPNVRKMFQAHGIDNPMAVIQ